MPETLYDALIVGSGASGMFAAKELTAQGLKVVQLEAGPEIGVDDFNPSSVRRQSEPLATGQGLHRRTGRPGPCCLL
ncbi:hypothetical protein GCM10010862_04880 [Devosia nitrariae]|uniref:FAD-binding protein n=1 Tax=Devosia nitrariae TaxID=2071872 RepID=A0ABQ5W0M9_9HYPH|nr:hypothetical protein GCM10010862_04880 [Devosia nitrariae]